MSQKTRRAARSDTISVDTVERDACEVDFTTMPNDIVNTRLLSWPAKAMLWYIVSKPHDWKVIPEQLRTVSAKRLSLPAVRKLLKEIIDAGYGHRELVFNDRHRIIGKRQIFSNRPKWRARAPEAQAGDSVSRFSDIRKDRQTENLSPVLSNDSKLTTPLPPSAEAHADPPGGNPVTRKSPSDLGAESEPPSADALPEAKDSAIAEATPAPVAAPATGSAREGVSETLKPITFNDFRKLYEPHKDRNMRRAEDDWNDLSPDLQLHAHGVLPQYFAHMARIGRKPDEAWKYLRLKAFRQYPLPRAGAADPEVPAARRARPTADEALATPIGLRAAQEGWAPDLADFVRVKWRMPEMDEIDRMEREGLENTLKYLEALGNPGHALGPYARQFLHKRWTVTNGALKAHLQREPTFEEYLAPARKLIADAVSARDAPPLPFARVDARIDEEIPI